MQCGGCVGVGVVGLMSGLQVVGVYVDFVVLEGVGCYVVVVVVELCYQQCDVFVYFQVQYFLLQGVVEVEVVLQCGGVVGYGSVEVGYVVELVFCGVQQFVGDIGCGFGGKGGKYGSFLFGLLVKLMQELCFVVIMCGLLLQLYLWSIDFDESWFV